MNLPIGIGAVGIGAAPFRQIAPTVSVIQPAPAMPQSPMSPATPSMPSASSALRQTLIEQAMPSSQAAVAPEYRWAVVNTTVTIGGYTFPAGTRIAVAPMQSMISGGGKAHTQSIVLKVWVKFGQTFDSSSWVQGALAANLFTYTGEIATWSSWTGFGAELPPAAAPANSFDKIAPYAYGFIGVVAVGLFAGVLTMRPGRR